MLTTVMAIETSTPEPITLTGLTTIVVAAAAVVGVPVIVHVTLSNDKPAGIVDTLVQAVSLDPPAQRSELETKLPTLYATEGVPKVQEDG